MTWYGPADVAPEGVPNYLVATPYYGSLDPEHIDCVLALKRLYPALRLYKVKGCAYVDIARATAAAACIEGGFDGLFFIDHDIIFEPADVVGLIRQAAREQTVCYGLYSMRKSGKRMIGAFDQSLFGADGKVTVKAFEGGGLYPGQDGGLGFAAIPRAVLEAVGRDMPELETGFSKVKPLFSLRAGVPDWAELFERMVALGAFHGRDERVKRLMREAAEKQAAGWYSGEDISFFHRVRRAGYQPLVDTRPRLAHHGMYRYGLEDVQICVPRADSLDLTVVKMSDPNDPAEQVRLAAAASQFEGLDGPVIRPKQAAE